MLSVTLAVVVCAAGGALAQGGPAGLPPEGFSGTQYVDGNGCVHVRAGYGGAVTWVPRMTRDRAPVCGQEPTFAQAPAAEPAGAVAVPVAAAPARSATVRATPARVSAPAPGRTAPVRSAEAQPIQVRNDLPPGPPRGYRLAFEDGRLNPHRGERSPSGRLEMDRYWTRDVPAQLVQPGVAGQGQAAPAPRVSSKGAPATVPRLVQAGVFADSAEARRAVARLQALGLPARSVAATANGRRVQLVLAGPFDDRASVDAAVALSRRNGFPEAIPRKQEERQY